MENENRVIGSKNKIIETVDRLAGGSKKNNLIFKARNDFPVIGRSDRLYIATDENSVYRFDDDTSAYIRLPDKFSCDYSDIENRPFSSVDTASGLKITDDGKLTENIQVGGRNLFLGTKNFDSNNWNNMKLFSIQDETYKGFTVIKSDQAIDSASKILDQTLEFELNEKYVFSAYIKHINPDANIYLYGNQTYYTRFLNNEPIVNTFSANKISEWSKVVMCCTIANLSGVRIGVGSDQPGLMICGIKFERGSKPTDWTPAPEDTDAKIDDIQVGGTNLYVGTKDFSGNLNQYGTPVTDSEKYNGFTVLLFANSWDRKSFTGVNGKIGETFTFSCWVKSAAEIAGTVPAIIGCYRGPSLAGDACAASKEIVISKEWQRVSFTYTLTENINDLAFSPYFPYHGALAEIGIKVCGYKLEHGDKATDWSPAPEDLQLKISDKTIYYNMLDNVIPVEQRRNIFRGNHLGGVFTDEQKANIRNGIFKGFFIGDFWEINGVTWRIVDINYWLNSGDTACTTPHLVIMPDSQLYTAQMNETNTTEGGYTGSKMYTENLENAKTLINSAFGAGNILNHKEYLTNAVTDGHASGGAWFNSTVELPNEIMMYGCQVFTNSGNGSTVPNKYMIDKTQLSLMKLYPKFINPGRYWYWLRDVVSSAHFAYVSGYGNTDYASASNSNGVRPVFGLTGGNT